VSPATDQGTVAPSPADTLPAPSEHELELLRQVGRHWNSVAGDSLGRLQELPVDPGLTRFPDVVGPGRFSKFVPIQMVTPEPGDELEATEAATEPPSQMGRLLAALRRAVIGPPLRSSAVVHERMRKLIALPVLSSDLLSSVAYGPEAMLRVLILAGGGALWLSLPLGAALVVLMIALGASYRQTIAAYPSGAGSYIVAGDNLGEVPGLAAAVGLMTDYVMTVAVSIAAGIAAITSAFPSLSGSAVPLGLVFIGFLLGGNLRGARQAGYLFAAPTYAFLLAIFLLVGVGLVDAAGNGFSAAHPHPTKAVEGLTLLLVLRAFSSGASSMTGIEAVSNAIPAFEPPEAKNARTTLTVMVGLLVVTFAGLLILIHIEGVVPATSQTVLSQLAHDNFGSGPLYGYVQATTALILLFAANTAYNDFPRLLYYMARNRHAPRMFLRMGDRLAFSNGILALTAAAAIVFIAFHGKTESLIPLYAVGVFLALTLSQSGMVVHWWRGRGRHWRKSLTINAIGAVLCALVLAISVVTKFTEGAWVTVIGIPVVIALCLRVRSHYDAVREALALDVPPAGAPSNWIVTPAEERDGAAAAEWQESPEQIKHLMVVPVARLQRDSLRALAYAASLEKPMLAVHLSPDDAEAARFERQWEAFGVPLRMEIVLSPYRAVVPPLSHYVEALHLQDRALTITVILPELVVPRPWQRVLHSRVASGLRRTLRARPGIVITSVPFHLLGSRP
jgi:amino acid transporter